MRIFIRTFGCTMNSFDSQVMQEQLEKAGHIIVDVEESADLIIVNTCIVKQPTEAKVLKYLKSIDKPFVIAGCFPVAYFSKLDSMFPNASMIGTNSSDIVDVVGRTSKGGCARNVRMGKQKICDLSGVTKIIAISEGCIGNCAYCAAKLARGGLKSYKPKTLIRNLRRAVESGAKEILLTSQDTGAYGTDINTNLVELLERIASLDGKFLVRVGMMNPDNAIKLMPDLVGCFGNEKIFRFLHMPVQSGSDNVLSDMGRQYTMEQFKDVISHFRKSLPDITISTDVICGFPTESEDDFNRTMKLVRWLKPDVLNISRFWPRPGTAAAELKPLHGRVTKDRSRRMTHMFHNISMTKNKKWLGWTGEVLIDEPGMGRNYAYKPVVVNGDVREFVRVRVTGAKRHYLIAKRL